MELTLSASRGWNERDASKEKVLGMDGGFRSSLFRYGISAIAILLAFAVRMLLDPYLGDYYPIVTFLVPVILIAWYGGLGPSIVAIIGALMLARYFFLAPRHSIGVEATEDQLGFALYACAGLVMTFFAQAWRTAHRRTEISEEQARQLVANLQESEERLRLVLEASATGWWYWDLTHDVVQADAQVKALFGLPAEAEASFDVFLQSLAPGESERVLEELPGAIHSSSDFEREFHLIWPDGSHHWILARGRALRNAAGQPQRLMGLVLDITQRKQAERRLHEHTVQLQAITDHAQDFIVRFDRDLRHLFVNRALAEAVHISVDQYLGRTNEELGMPAECVALWNRHLRRVFETGQPESMEFDMELDGESRSFSSLIVPERAGEQGATETVLAITRDVTDAKRAEVALKMWNEELEVRVAERTAAVEQGAARLRMLAAELTQAEQSERRRLARILHDHLQQLLVAARMRISTLRRDAHNEKAAAMLQQIHELLDQCLAESRSLTVELSPPILNEAGLGPGLQWLARQMEEKHHLHVEVDVDSAAEPTCEVKRVFLFQAVRELLLNVVKHAQVDTAYVKVTPLENDGLRLVVADFGQGFDLAQLEGHRPSGGFGLFSIRERLEVLGGRLQIDAAPGRGARMVIEISRTGTALPDGGTLVETGLSLPRTATPPEPVETPVSRRERKTRVLLADDHAIVRQGLAGLLREHDAIDVVGEAVDGQEAVELTRQTRPDVVLMDITMPRLNGIEATRRIMEMDPAVRIIGLSMHAEADMAAAMQKAGAAAYFSKDVAPEKLFSAIFSRS
jgi:PAS domain S-box-containing protein